MIKNDNNINFTKRNINKFFIYNYIFIYENYVMLSKKLKQIF